jgi:energy-coupling factor transport system substrate-specific component
VKRRVLSWFLVLVTAGGAWLAYQLWPDEDLNWALTSLLLLLMGLGLFYLRFERARVSSKELAVIASLSALAIVGRLVFAAFPHFKPTSFLIILAGYVFGPRAGFMVGATTALGSNLFLGQGGWTPWQMFAWGLMGAFAGLYGRWRGERVTPLEIAGIGFVWGFLFGWILNLWTWLSSSAILSWKTLVGYYVASFSFEVTHAIGNVVFALLFTSAFLPILMRFRKKLTITRLEVEGRGE